jgi:hypothetical protein
MDEVTRIRNQREILEMFIERTSNSFVKTDRVQLLFLNLNHIFLEAMDDVLDLLLLCKVFGGFRVKQPLKVSIVWLMFLIEDSFSDSL